MGWSFWTSWGQGLASPPHKAHSVIHRSPTQFGLINSVQSMSVTPLQDFLGVTSGKVPACQCRGCTRYGFDPWIGKIPWRMAWQPTPVVLPGESHGQRSLAGYSPRSCKQDMTEAMWQARQYCSLMLHLPVSLPLCHSLIRHAPVDLACPGVSGMPLWIWHAPVDLACPSVSGMPQCIWHAPVDMACPCGSSIQGVRYSDEKSHKIPILVLLLQ